MTEKEFAKLKVGDKVRIVSTKTGERWNNMGEMDKWLGKIMTVRGRSRFNLVNMEEDKGAWSWWPEMVAEKIEPVKEVKRAAKVGEWIKVVNPMFNSTYHKDDILQVSKLDPSKYYGLCVNAYKNGDRTLDSSFLWECEYVVLENYVPEDKPEPVKSGRYPWGSEVKPEPKKVEEHSTIVQHLIKGRKTIVKLSDGRVGVAVCSDEDEFDICEGLRLATERAYGKVEAYKKPQPVKEVKRAAKVGEWIKIVDATFSLGAYKNGDIKQVIRDAACAGDVVININGRLCSEACVWQKEYVVLENYKPDKK